MTLQLTQTRILSWIYYNHVVYLTVTIALLGFGVSGVVIALVAKQGRRLEVWMLAAAGGFAVSIPACIRLASLSTTLFDKTGEQLRACWWCRSWSRAPRSDARCPARSQSLLRRSGLHAALASAGRSRAASGCALVAFVTWSAVRSVRFSSCARSNARGASTTPSTA
jgi:hypothetical protein